MKTSMKKASASVISEIKPKVESKIATYKLILKSEEIVFHQMKMLSNPHQINTCDLQTIVCLSKNYLDNNNIPSKYHKISINAVIIHILDDMMNIASNIKKLEMKDFNDINSNPEMLNIIDSMTTDVKVCDLLSFENLDNKDNLESDDVDNQSVHSVDTVYTE